MNNQSTQASADAPVQAQPGFAEALNTWARIGVLSFGGPAAQIALMHRIIVDEKKWLAERQFLNALSFCMLLPGPEAMQLATYSGWRLHGLWGGLAAGLLFVVPGAIVVLVLAAVYAAFGNQLFVEAVFLGIKAAVLVIVIEALMRIARRALDRREYWWIAGASFVLIFFLSAPFPLIILIAALIGFALAVREDADAQLAPLQTVSLSRTLRTVCIWLVLWLVPLGAVAFVFGRDHVLSQLAWFFSKLAVVTFGGAYAVLAYMGQDVVLRHGWLDAGQMMDGLGLAETTPGPLILVTEFVGYVAAYQHGTGPALLMGLLGATIALWATFVPCFLWIFAGAPYVEWIIAQPRLRGALSAITAAVVGVILNLALWFALHVFFGNVGELQAGPVRLWLPDLETFDLRAGVLAAISGILLLRLHWGIGPVLAVAAALAIAIRLTGIIPG